MDKTKDNLFRAIRAIIETMPMPFDQTRDGYVVEILDHNFYKVKIQDVTYKIKSQFHFNLNEKVSVVFKCGSKSNLYIYPNKPDVIVSDTEPTNANVGDIWIKI